MKTIILLFGLPHSGKTLLVRSLEDLDAEGLRVMEDMTLSEIKVQAYGLAETAKRHTTTIISITAPQDFERSMIPDILSYWRVQHGLTVHLATMNPSYDYSAHA